VTTDAERLHTAARRYLMERYQYWAARYAKLTEGAERSGVWKYSDEELRTFPRYNVLDAILTHVERFDPTHFVSLEEARRIMGAQAFGAQNMFTDAPDGSVELSAMNEERHAFYQFVLGVTSDDLASVEPLFYRRVLSQDESDEVWNRVESRWGIKKANYWYPLTPYTGADVAAFQDRFLEEAIPKDTFRTLLSRTGLTRIYELREYGPEYCLDVEAAFEPFYNGAEGYWCSEQMNWLVYASHESSITLGGWLLDEVKQLWPEWHKYIWSTPLF